MLGRLSSETGREPSKLLVSSAIFEDAVVQRMGGSVFAQRLWESQNPGAGLNGIDLPHSSCAQATGRGFRHCDLTMRGDALPYQRRHLDVSVASAGMISHECIEADEA